jgi:hypothetical protein
MAITQATSSVLAANAALNNLNAGASIVFTKPLTVANFTIGAGSTATFNATTYTYGTGAAAAHRTALGLSTLATTTPAANVATFLATPTSANLAAAVSDETGSGLLVFGTSPTISSPTINTAITLNATTYTYGIGAADAHRTALSINNVDNTSDLNKPISTAVASALSAKSDIVNPARTTLTGDGTTSVFAISGAGSLTNPSALIVAIDGALQEPSVDYTVSGGNITFTDPLASGAKAVVIAPTNTLQVGELIPSDGSVTSAKLAPNLTLTNTTLNGTLTVNATTYTYGTGAASAHRTALELDRYYNSRDINLQSSTTIYDFDNSYMPATLGLSISIPSGGQAQIANVGGTHWTSKVKGWLRAGNPTTNNAVTEVIFVNAVMPYQGGSGSPTASNDYTLVYVFACPVLTNVDIRFGLRIGNVARLVQIFQDDTASPGSNPVFNFFTNNGTYTTTSTANGAIAGAPTPQAGSYTTAVGTRYAFVFDTYQRAGGTDTTVVLKIYSGNITGDLTLAGTYDLTSWNPMNAGATPYVAVRNLNSSASLSTSLQLDTMIFKAWNNTSNILPTEILDIFKTT